MRKTDEAARMVAFRLVQIVIDEAAGCDVWLIEARAAGQHRHVDTGAIHHPYMRRQVGEQRVKTIIGITALIELDRAALGALLHQLGRGVVMLEVDDHR